jgi:hypothetical protein
VGCKSLVPQGVSTVPDTFSPPRPPCADALVVFERHAERLYREGRWTSVVDRDNG